MGGGRRSKGEKGEVRAEVEGLGGLGVEGLGGNIGAEVGVEVGGLGGV